MHELLLYGQVPNARLEQVLQVLAGVAAMKPQLVYERHLMYRQKSSPEAQRQSKKFPNRQIKPPTLLVHHLQRELDEDDFGEESPVKPASGDDEAAAPWILRAADVPEPETKAFIVRRATEAKLVEEKWQQLQNPAVFTYATEYITEGFRFIHKDLIIHIHRLLRLTDPPTQPATALPPLKGLKLMDVSGAFILEACVRVEDRTNQNLMSSARDQLVNFQKTMEGVVQMRAPDRLALDTRAR